MTGVQTCALPISSLSSPQFVDRGFVQTEAQIQILTSKRNPHLFHLHHSRIVPTHSQTHRNYFLIHKNPKPLSYRHTSISRYYCMYTKTLVQNNSVSPEALQACLIAARAQFTLESLRFLSQKSIIVIHFKLPEKRTLLRCIYSVESILTPSLTQLTPVRDRD